MDKGARNDLSAAVPKFCLALEEYRRTAEGKVRTSQDMLTAFFPHDDKASTDKVFKYLPNEVRGPIVAAWGIRGMKAALRDTDDRIQQVVYDALVAGDIDHQAFEDGLAPETLVRWVPLGDLWSFWRGGKLSKQAIHKAMATAYELYLFDARWFLDTLSAKGGTLKGTDVLSDGLTKDDLTQWVRRIHETGDGTPKGIVGALGWEKIVAKTANDVLVAVLDAVVAKVGLVVPPAKEGKDAGAPAKPEAAAAKAEPPAAATPTPGAAAGDDEPIGNYTEPPPTGRPGGTDDTWSMPPAPPRDEREDSGIHVDVDEMLAEKGAPPTAPRIAVAPPARPDEDDTEVKAAPRGGRSERPPQRPSGRPR